MYIFLKTSKIFPNSRLSLNLDLCVELNKIDKSGKVAKGILTKLDENKSPLIWLNIRINKIVAKCGRP